MAFISKSKRLSEKSVMDDPTGISILHPIGVSNDLKNHFFVDEWYSPKIFFLDISSGDYLRRKSIQFGAKNVSGYMRLKPLVFEIRGREDNDSHRRS